MRKLLAVMGLAGLDESENDRAKLWYQILEWPMILAGLWLLALWYQGIVTSEPVNDSHLELGLWMMFVLETGLMTLMVDDRTRYLKSNWMNVVIILIGLPLFLGISSYSGALRLIRILILLDLSMHVSSSIARLLSRNALGPTFAGSAIVIFMAGFMIAGIDPAIETATEGIWWAWVTVTTVGYGDIVPSSSVGRVFAGILILIGIGLISLLTASIAAITIERAGSQEKAENPIESSADRKLLEDKIEALEYKLDRILEHLNDKKQG